MHSRTIRTILATSLATALPAGVIQAQEFDLGEIVVTPSRTESEKGKVGSVVETVDREEIEERAQPLLLDYLGLIPGIAITAPGGHGAEASLAIRGAPRRYVKTLYNGIDISDPTAPNVQTSYQYLLAGGLDRIEVLKGSQSTHYGSDAIAGVISLSTLGDIEQGVTHLLHGEGGSRNTWQGSYGLRAASGDSRLSLNLTGFHTDGISAAALGTERDGYRNVTFDLAGEHAFSEDFSVFASLLYIDAKAEYDDEFSSPPVDDLFNTNLSEQLAARAGFNLDLMDGRFRNTVSVQAFDITRTMRTAFPDDLVWEGQRYKADYQGAFDVNEWLTMQGGAEIETQKAEAFGVSHDFTLGSFWTEALVEPTDDLALTFGLRHDIHSEFGDHTSFRATGSYTLPGTGTRFHSSVGTGFRAPSLDELFLAWGANPDLQPETSFSFDAGIEQTFLDGRAVADVTFFMLDIEDAIRYIGGSYVQTNGKARSRGVETTLAYAVNDWLNVGAAYTYTSAHAPDAAGVYGRDIRVPRHEVGLSVSAEPWEKWSLSATARIVVDTLDRGGVKLDDYVLLNAKVAYKATETTEFYVRGENLLDQDYQTARGFNTPGLSVFAGFRASFGP